MDYAAYGGARVSWTVPLYILGANFAEQMPQDEDWMPLNGNPHPFPGVPFPELPPFNLPAYPALGWNAVPPPPPEPVINEVAEDNWGNWQDNVEPEPVQDQESMVVDLSAQPSSAADQDPPVIVVEDDLSEAPVVPLVNEDAANNWAIVVYQPPTVREEIALPVIPFGPPLPPDMIWRRSFESLLQAPVAFSVPRPVLLQPLSPVVLSKRSWDLAFSDSDLPRLTWREEEPARPVARALFSDPVDVQPV